MKMSDYFKKEVNCFDVSFVVADEGGALYASIEQEKAINHAVNHHDALVEILDELTDDFEVWNVHGGCNSCGTHGHHTNECAYQNAVNLLDEINKNDK